MIPELFGQGGAFAVLMLEESHTCILSQMPLASLLKLLVNVNE